MRTPPSLLLITLLTTACGSSNCNSQATACLRAYEVPPPTTSTGTGAGSLSAPPASAPEAERDTLAFVTTDAGVFAVAAVRPADEVRIYRVEATADEEAPIEVTLAGKLRFHEGDAPERVVADAEGHALVTLGRDRSVATIDPITSTRLGDAHAAPSNATRVADTNAYVADGDAYVLTESADGFSRVGAPGLTRAVALADVHLDDVTRRIVALQTEEPRMLVFFSTSDMTMPIAFEPLE